MYTLDTRACVVHVHVHDVEILEKVQVQVVHVSRVNTSKKEKKNKFIFFKKEDIIISTNIFFGLIGFLIFKNFGPTFSILIYPFLFLIFFYLKIRLFKNVK